MRKDFFMHGRTPQHINDPQRHQLEAPAQRCPVSGWQRLACLLALGILAALVMLMGLPASPAAAKSLHPQDQISSLEQQMFSLINQDRAARGRPALVWNATLASGARAHSNRMAAGCGAVHQCPGEPDPPTRISNEGVSWTSWGENVGYKGGSSYTDDIKWIEQSMINEGPSGYHYQNLMSTAFKQLGVGVSIDSQGYVWVTEDFVQP